MWRQTGASAPDGGPRDRPGQAGRRQSVADACGGCRSAQVRRPPRTRLVAQAAAWRISMLELVSASGSIAEPYQSGGPDMTKVLKEVLAANGRYADDFGDRSKLPMPPGRRFAILTCMDARLDPAKFAGLAEGDAHVIRNAGGRASDDAIRSLVISYKLLGTREWFVIHHTDCGMETFTDEIMRGLLASSLETATIDKRGWHDTGKGPGSGEARYIDWLTIDDNAKSVVEDVARIRNHPLVNKSIPIYGYIYDVKSGRLLEVAEASQAGSIASAKARRPAKGRKAAATKGRKSDNKPGKRIKAAAIKGRRSDKRKAA
jgi:carbonic anhydrase